jgi:hypothetical protein
MGGDASSGFQDIAGDGEFVGGCADISKRVMKDEVLEMNEFTVDPERGMRVEEMRALEKAITDGRTGDALIETGKSDPSVAFTLSFQTRKCHLPVRLG